MKKKGYYAPIDQEEAADQFARIVAAGVLILMGMAAGGALLIEYLIRHL